MIGIIVAMEIELSALQNQMVDVVYNEINQIKFIQGRFSNTEIVACLSGIGKTSAAIACGVLLNNYQVDYIINIGSCGATQEFMQVGDVVVADKVACYDIDIPNWQKSFENSKITEYSNPDLFKHALSLKLPNVYLGSMVCGDTFIYNDIQINKVLNFFPYAYATDMESYAILKTCNHYGLACLIIRGVSDNVLRKDSEITFDQYVLEASKRSVEFCEKFMSTFKN